MDSKKEINNQIPDPDYVYPHPLASLFCVGGLGYLLPAIAFWPELLPPANYAGRNVNLGFIKVLGHDFLEVVLNFSRITATRGLLRAPLKIQSKKPILQRIRLYLIVKDAHV
jgi:hypothetical protein